MNYENYDDVRSQIMDAGLLLDAELKIGGARSERCRVEGRGKEKRGWYWLHEAPIEGRLYLIGAYGVYEGNDPGTKKIELTKQCEGDGCRRNVSFKEKRCPHCGSPVKRPELSKEQQDAIRTRLAEDKKREEARRRNELDRAARRAEKMWCKCQPITEQSACPYLVSRGVQPHRLRMTPNGTLAVPMQDSTGRVWGLQFIGLEVRKKLKDDDKQFWPYGTSQTGRFFMIGTFTDVILVCEGFVTGAALHEETGLCVVVAFNAGNLRSVADVIHKKYRTAKLLFCADDDFATRGNPGIAAATLAALAVGGAWVAPIFPDDEPVRADIAAACIDFEAKDYKQKVEAVRRGRKKLTDFDDLRRISPPHTVRAQIEAKLDEVGQPPAVAPRVADDQGARGRALTPINSTPEMFERYSLIYGHNKALFDHQERMLVAIDDMKNACSGREIWRGWMESQEKKIVRIENVGFDPGNADPAITCNLFGGWPIEPKAGACEIMLEILSYLCSNEQNHRDLYQWILKWMAYPLQHPGAKMKTALLVHGPQRVGKNFFFESYMGIFGQYGQVIDQDALEDKYNDCFSRKLFLVADEVIARQEMFHVKNKLKGMITGTRIRINPKNVKSYWETNHCNIIFLSNETMPLVLERDDGRFVVLWTPPKLSPEFYKEVEREVDTGGIAALYHYLLNLPLGDFGPHTPPPMTDAKRDLMDLSMDSTERFWIEWSKEAIQPVPFLPVKSTQLYAFYREWCGRCGYPRYAPEPRFLAEVSKRTNARRIIGRYVNGSGTKQATFIMPAYHDQPPDKTQAAWLSDCVQEFTSGVSEWRSEHESP